MNTKPVIKLDTSQQNLIKLIRAQHQPEAEVIAAIAAHCSCSRELIYQWKRGNRRITDTKLRQLAEFFGVSESYMKYGTPSLDADNLGEIAAGAIEALVEAGCLDTTLSPAQIGHFIAQIAADHESEGAIDRDQIHRYIRMIVPRHSVLGKERQ